MGLTKGAPYKGRGEGAFLGFAGPPPPTPPQPNLAIARVRPFNNATEVGNSRLRLGEGSSSRRCHGFS